MTYQPATRRLLLDDMETFAWNELLSEQTAKRGILSGNNDPLLSLTCGIGSGSGSGSWSCGENVVIYPRTTII